MMDVANEESIPYIFVNMLILKHNGKTIKISSKLEELSKVQTVLKYSNQ